MVFCFCFDLYLMLAGGHLFGVICYDFFIVICFTVVGGLVLE